MMIFSRTYSDDDLPALLDFLVRVRPAARIDAYPGLVDLHELLALEQVQANTRLWFGVEKRLVAFALVDHYANLCFEIDPHAASVELEEQVVAWGEACLRRGRFSEDETLYLDASCRSDDHERMAFLERHGFVRQETQSLLMARRLDEPIPAAVLPPGFVPRPVSGEQEAPALVELHRAAFETENMTLAERLAMMRTPDYDPNLDLVVVAPDGRLAAYCLCSISVEENQRSGNKDGYTDPVATHPDFQGRGLSKALLLSGLRLLKERGMDTARLGTSSENLAMQRAAQSAGFHIVARTIWFSRRVEE